MKEGRKWWRAHEGWVAVLLMGAGFFSIGCVLTGMHYERVLLKQSTACSYRAKEAANAYAEAVKAKDLLIKNLADKSSRAAASASQALKEASEPKTQAELCGWTKP